MPTVVIAASRTAGHVVPALAVADELRASGADVVWVGTRERAEAQLVPAAGYPIEFLSVTGLDRHNPVRAMGAVARAGAAVGTARGLLGRLGADAVLAGGGYVAGPVGLAAVARRTPLRAERGGQPPRPRKPHARTVRAPRLSRVPDRGT